MRWLVCRHLAKMAVASCYVLQALKWLREALVVRSVDPEHVMDDPDMEPLHGELFDQV